MANWKYTLPNQLRAQLKSNIDNSDYYEILSTLRECYDWILANVEEYDEWEYDRDIEDIEFWSESELTEDDEEEIDYLLSNFYDVCDGYRIWASAI